MVPPSTGLFNYGKGSGYAEKPEVFQDRGYPPLILWDNPPVSSFAVF
jgi:hypothetical protein